jgi:hypothetical protein
VSKAAESARLRSRRFVFRTLDFVLDESDLHNRIRQVSGANMLEGYSEKFALLQRDHVGNNNDDASVKRFFAVQIKEVGAIVRDERVLLLANNTHKLPIFQAAESTVADMVCAVAR